jgi:hypothetical protein
MNDTSNNLRRGGAYRTEITTGALDWRAAVSTTGTLSPEATPAGTVAFT